jgi:hypothetical protein
LTELNEGVRLHTSAIGYINGITTNTPTDDTNIFDPSTEVPVLTNSGRIVALWRPSQSDFGRPVRFNGC